MVGPRSRASPRRWPSRCMAGADPLSWSPPRYWRRIPGCRSQSRLTRMSTARRSSTPPAQAGRCRACRGSSGSSTVGTGGPFLGLRFRSPPSTLRRSTGHSGLHPYIPAGAPTAGSAGAWRLRDSRASCPPARSALRSVEPSRLPVGGAPSRRASRPRLRPLLTPRSAACRPRRPFRREARSPQVRIRGFPRTTAGSTSPPLGRESFAVCCPLALVGAASYPVPVRRLAASLPASFGAPLAVGALRFARGPCDRVPRRTSTSKSRPCWAHNERRAPRSPGGPPLPFRNADGPEAAASARRSERANRSTQRSGCSRAAHTRSSS